MPYRKPTVFPRASGVLMHISSLPGDFGIGCFGEQAKNFIDKLADAGIRYWQTLPFGPVDAFNSPYKSLSAFAFSSLFIDPQGLYEEGLLTEAQRDDAKIPGSAYSVDYAAVRAKRPLLLAQAFEHLTAEQNAAIDAFVAKERHWLPDYALCKAIQKEEDGRPWMQWKDAALRSRDPKALAAARKRLSREIRTEYFIQHQCLHQWQAIREYARKKGVGIIGDMPIYVDIESADVWVHPELFELDADGRPTLVAGVPPDYFSADGQLWGNPLYNWKTMADDDYAWWVRRLGHSFQLFDAVRIDHFRAFSAYWAVPGDAKTARKGQWLPGPGTDLFNILAAHYDLEVPRIIAEDLGVMDDGVRGLLQDTGFPGMGVMQFGFIDDSDNIHLPHNFDKQTIAYTGTHDNNTLLGWMWEIDPRQRRDAFAYIGYPCEGDAWQQGGPQSASCRAFIRALWQSGAALSIVPVQDLCGFGGDTAMNHPGKAEGNWAFRLPQEELDRIDWNWLKELNRLYKRA
jgi:4-alpha-glucanotransferase